MLTVVVELVTELKAACTSLWEHDAALMVCASASEKRELSTTNNHIALMNTAWGNVRPGEQHFISWSPNHEYRPDGTRKSMHGSASLVWPKVRLGVLSKKSR